MKQLIEEVFGVKVISLNSLILSSKKRRLGKFEGFKSVNKRFFVTILVCFLLIDYLLFLLLAYSIYCFFNVLILSFLTIF